MYDSTQPLNPTAVKAAGGAAVGRYIYGGFDSRAKVWLTEPEVRRYLDNGLAVVLIFEMGANDVLDGYQAGKQRAALANQDCEKLGMPGAVVYWTSDRDVVVGNLSQALEYARGWSEVMGRGRRGCYGDKDVIDSAFKHGYLDYGWQAAAASWSNYGLSANACMVQRVGYVNIGGIDTDRNDIMAGFEDDYGQWPRQESGVSKADVLEGLAEFFNAPNGIEVIAGQKNNAGAFRILAQGVQSAVNRDNEVKALLGQMRTDLGSNTEELLGALAALPKVELSPEAAQDIADSIGTSVEEVMKRIQFVPQFGTVPQEDK